MLSTAFLSWLKLSVYMAIVSVAIILSFHLKSEPTPLGKSRANWYVTYCCAKLSQKSVSHYRWESFFGCFPWHACYQDCRIIFIRSHGIVSGGHWCRRAGRRRSFSRWCHVPLLRRAYCSSQPTRKSDSGQVTGISNTFDAVDGIS